MIAEYHTLLKLLNKILLLFHHFWSILFFIIIPAICAKENILKSIKTLRNLICGPSDRSFFIFVYFQTCGLNGKEATVNRALDGSTYPI
jgi:hypothetical protein